MRLERLDIQQLPGIRPGFALEDLDPGLNLVVGPNASGKSSIARALSYLLKEPDRSDPSALALEADLRDEQGILTVRRTGSGIAWLREGVPVEPPPLPDSRFFHCWWLTVEELLQAAGGEGMEGGGERDWEIADRLQRELTGGYDVEALLGERGPFHIGPRHGATESKEYTRRCAEVREVERAYEGLQQERERIPELEQRIEAGSGLQVRIGHIERARELLTAQRERRTTEAALEAFPAEPEEMDRLRGDEGERLDSLESRRRKMEEDERTWQSKRREADEAVARTGLGERIPDEEALEAQQRLLQKAQTGLVARQDALERRDEAQAEEEGASREIGAPEGTLPVLDPETVAEAERIAGGWTTLRQEIKELEARLRDLPEPGEQAELERHREGAGALRTWLRAGYLSGRRLAVAAAAVLAGPLAAVIAVLTGTGWLGIAAALLAAGGIIGLVLMTDPARRQRADAERRFQASGLEAPPQWEAGTVETRLNEIEETAAALRDRQARAAGAEQDRRRLAEREEDLQRVEEEKAALARQVGFDPELPVAALDRFVRLVEKVDASRSRCREADKAVERTQGEVAGLASEVAVFLSEWGEREVPGPDACEPAALFAGPPETVLESLAAGLNRLAAKCRAVREGRRDIMDADGNLERIEEEAGRLAQEIEGVLTGAGLAPDERETLEERLRVLDAFRERQRELQEALSGEAKIRSGLEEEEELLALVAADDEEGLSDRLEQARTEETERETFKDALTAIRTRLQSAGTDLKLEEALARREEARAACEKAREGALQAAAGRFLLEEVKEGYRTEHEPAVLQDARERFERFTRHGWSLELDEQAGFTARDLEQGERRGLGELSSATRMQLLLAARMAWTRHLEAGRETLPFFLDEALTTTDPERFHEVASSIISLVEEEGRQIFYLCAQPTYIQLWERSLERLPHVIDLLTARFGLTADTTAGDFELPEQVPIPAPGNLSAAEYAVALGVGPIDPWEDPGGINIFHLLRDDLERLYALLVEWGSQTLGPLEGLLAGAAGALAVPDEDRRRRLAERCRAARAWIEAWRQGRGRPVDRGVLEECEVVTGHFIEGVAELAAEVEGDPEEILERLDDISGWGKTKIRKLREWLEDQGHLDAQPVLDAPGREARVLSAIREGAEPGDVRETLRWLEAGLGADQAE